jgi:serine/threonine protein kinase
MSAANIAVIACLVIFAVACAAILIHRLVASKRQDRYGDDLDRRFGEDDANEGTGLVAAGGRGGAAAPPRYTVLRKLGDGTYGVVYLAKRHADDLNVAVKIIPCNDERAAEEAMNEFRLCQALQGHDNVIKLMEVFQDYPAGTGGGGGGGRGVSPGRMGDMAKTVALEQLKIPVPRGVAKYICIVTEFYEEGTLFDLLARRNTGLPEEKVWAFARQLLESLLFVHDHGVIHRDMKPSNVLLSEHMQRLVLTDFGLSREADPDQYVNTKIGTYHYMAPEQMQRRYTSKADIWGVGCLVHAMCTVRVSTKEAMVMFLEAQKPAFAADMRADVCGRRGYSAELFDFMLLLLSDNPSARPSAAEALRRWDGKDDE